MPKHFQARLGRNILKLFFCTSLNVLVVSRYHSPFKSKRSWDLLPVKLQRSGEIVVIAGLTLLSIIGARNLPLDDHVSIP